MKFIAFSDLHGNKKTLSKIIKRAKKDDIELIISAGDHTIFGQEQNFIFTELNKIGKPVLVIHGNHEDQDETRDGCKRFKNLEFIHNKVWRKEDRVFIGWGGGGFRFRDKTFEKHANNLKNKLKKGDKIIFITHAPPYGTKIDDLGGEHAGNKSFRKFIDLIKPQAAISGHLHECVGKQQIGRTVVINPSYEGRIIVV